MNDIRWVISIYRKHNNAVKRRGLNSNDGTYLYCLYFDPENRIKGRKISALENLVLRGRKVKRRSISCQNCGRKFEGYFKIPKWKMFLNSSSETFKCAKCIKYQ